MSSASMPRSERGFSLIELMVAVAIVGVLAAIAIPSYNQYVRRANRSDATRTLLSDAQALQRCYSQNFTYTPATLCTPAAGTTTSPGGYYQVTVALTATTYTLTAVASANPQTQDTQCRSFTLNSSGTQSSLSSSSMDTTVTCWGTK